MTSDVLKSGVVQALGNQVHDEAALALVAAAIGEQALFDGPSGKQLLAIDEESNEVIQFDISKAVLAAAGVLGAALPLLTGPVGVACVLSAIGALGALQGLSRPLPGSCAVVLRCLLPAKVMSREDLWSAVAAGSPGVQAVSDDEFDAALERLREVGSIRVKDDQVRLVERVLVRR